MTSFVFDDYVRATMGGARNVSGGKVLSPDQVQRVADYLKAPGSGPDATSSYETFVSSRMATHPPTLPPGYDYVGFSGKDSAGTLNYDNAVEYTEQLGGGAKAGIIGDTRWGEFINATPANPEFDMIEQKFKVFLGSEGIAPYSDAAGALQDMMWNAGSSRYLHNAMNSGRPFVAFVENAPLGRGFSTFELPTAQQYSAAVTNGYPMRSFGPDPLAFASKSAAEFQQLEKSLAESATINGAHPVSVGDLRAKVYVASGYNAASQSVFGHSLTEFRQLTADQMTTASNAWSFQEAARLSGAHASAAKAVEHPSPVVERQAPGGPPSLQSLHESEAGSTTHGQATLERETAFAGRAGPSLAVTGLKVAGVAAVAYDTANTASKTSDLLHAGNVTGGQSELVHFASRNLGVVAGAEAVGGAAALAGVESGPGVVVFGAVGAIGGAIAGDKIANAIDNHRIYNQSDTSGKNWHYDPAHPDRGWTHTETVMKTGPNGARYFGREQHGADASLTNTLNYKASGTAVDLALAHSNTPADPYAQRPGPHDTASVLDAPWVRDPQSHAWSRHVTDQMLEHGMTSSYTEMAAPTRAVELEQSAKATIAANLADSPHGIAQHYAEVYERNGWQAQGPMPESVTHALKQPENVQDASDGHAYTQGADGHWRTPGMLYGTNEAKGNVHDELEATKSAAVMLNHAAHPDHALFRQAETHVHALDAKYGRTPDQGSENLAAALTVAAKQGGLRKIDTLALSDDGSQVFVADVIIPKTLNNVASVETVPAIQTPVEQSSQKIDQVNIDLAAQAQAQSHQQPVSQQHGHSLPGR